MNDSVTEFSTLPFAAVRTRLLAREEIALVDVREEDPFAQAHPLWAANLPLSRLELDAWRRIPRRDTLIVLYGAHDGVDLAPRAASVLARLGYSNLHLLAGGLDGWSAAGGELFRDVNVPGKAFGELVEHERHTPSLSAQEVKALIDARANVVVLDARRFDEYQTMSIPSATSVPGAELVLRVRALAPDPTTQVIVNCAGRTRSIIGTQSLVNAGIPNPVAALRNGTIGWKLAGQTLDHGAGRRGSDVSASDAGTEISGADASSVAARAGVHRIALEALHTLESPGRTVFHFDVRTPEEFVAGHLPGFASAPGGQLVQETDHHVPVRGACIVLDADDGVRASMTGSWLAQMGWEVHVVDVPEAGGRSQRGVAVATQPVAPTVAEVGPAELARWLRDASGSTQLIDIAPGVIYRQQHIPGAWFAIRAQLDSALRTVPPAARYVLTCRSSVLARHAVAEVEAALRHGGRTAEVWVLEGGTAAWAAAGLALEQGETRLATPITDRYRRPYEGTDASAEAMQAYLDWEYGLVAQLARDGTHHFQVL